MTALMANIFSYSDIGFWSQALFSASLFTTIVGFDIPNAIIAIVPKLKFKRKIWISYISQFYLYL